MELYRSTGNKPVPGLLCSPPITHGLPWDRTRASTVRHPPLAAAVNRTLPSFLIKVIMAHAILVPPGLH